MAQDQGDPPLEPLRPGVDPAVPALEARLGCPLPDAELALAALTHKSYVNEHRTQALRDNERLEFLGDAVIDLAVAHRLMERFPDAREGDLSKLRAAVVDEAGIARMAREIGLGPLLRLGRGEELTGGREKASLLADAMEAVIAAVYLSGGLEPVLMLVDRFLGDAFQRAADGTLDRDFKTQFQELAQSRLRAIPRYRVVAERGPDHAKTFEVELHLRGEVVGRGVGRSKKDAEQSAAKGALDTMNGRFGAEPRVVQVSSGSPESSPPEAAQPVQIDLIHDERVQVDQTVVEEVETVEREIAAIAPAAEEARATPVEAAPIPAAPIPAAPIPAARVEAAPIAAGPGGAASGAAEPVQAEPLPGKPAPRTPAKRTAVVKRRRPIARHTTVAAKPKKPAGRTKPRAATTKRKARAKR